MNGVCREMSTKDELGEMEKFNVGEADVTADQQVHRRKQSSKESKNSTNMQEKEALQQFIPQLVWRNIIVFVYLHLAALYGFILGIRQAGSLTWLWVGFFGVCSGLGITAGAHRLWSHRSYKAKLPLRIILGVFNTIALQNDIFEWSRDHRVHHKFSETDADPHNAKRGFFFAHMGWLLQKKHPDVIRKGRTVYVDDLLEDSVVFFQRRYYLPLVVLMSVIIPTYVPITLWGETLKTSFHLCFCFRYILTLHMTWLVNSAAHLWGNKPYNKYINPSENYGVAICAIGEGWHNYHHCFPWDYKTAELGSYAFNVTTAFIDFFAKIGWAYDLRTTASSMISRCAEQKGDGTHALYKPKSSNSQQSIPTV